MKKLVLIGAGMVLALLAGGLLYVATACPCEQMPGVTLSGEESVEEVSDWSFVNDTGLCQLQVSNSVLPQSLNLNCMSGDGDLFISCSRCDGKRWSGIALEHPDARIKIGDVIYPVVLQRVTDAAELDRAWQARITKLRRLGGEPPDERPDHWWSFQLVSRSG